MSKPNDSIRADIVAFLDDQQSALLEFLYEMIATPSTNPPGDERAVAALVSEKLRTFGLGDIALPAKADHRPNVVGRLAGSTRTPTLLFNGHLDTKPVGEDVANQWNTDPLTPTLIDGRIYGLGATDMKGGVAAMIYAAGALSALSVPLRGNLLCAFSADEEAGSEFGAAYLVEEYGLKADLALISEPSGIHTDFEQLCIASRGSLCFRTRVRGTQMHSSTTDRLPAVNACTKLAEVVTRMNKELVVQHDPHPLYPKGPTKNIGVTLEGGVFYGVCPGYAEFRSDIRIIPGMTPAGVARDVEAFLDTLRAEDPALDVEMTVELHAPSDRNQAQPEVQPDEPFVGMLLDASETVLGRRPPLGGFPGGTDAGTLHGVGGIPTIPAFGPGLLPLAHGPNEYVSADSVIAASKIYALAALDYLS